jgi:hypothetical protein
MLQKLIDILLVANDEKLIRILYRTAASYVEHKKIENKDI